MPPIKGQTARHGNSGLRTRLGYALAGATSLTPLPVHAQSASFYAADIGVLSAAVAGGAVALAIAVGCWALAEQRSANRLRRKMRDSHARARAAVSERDALIAAGREALVVWGRDGRGPYAYRGADQLLDSCLAGTQARTLAAALDLLGEKGTSFAMTAPDRAGHLLAVRGRAVGGMAAVWLEQPEASAMHGPNYEAILDSLPVPVWLRDETLALQWGNKSFVKASGSQSLANAIVEQVALENSERDLASMARSQGQSLSTQRYTTMDGARRVLAFTHVPLDGGLVLGTALDSSETSSAEAQLQQQIDAHADAMNKLSTAVAIYGPDQRLRFYNRAFAQLWALPRSWLDSHPRDGEVLDRLREARKLPEQRDYLAWKRHYLALYETPQETKSSEDIWHIPTGAALRVVAQPHATGGVSYLFEDVTEKIALESSYNTALKVQSATLNMLQEAVAAFGLDGRLKLYNAAFAQIWDLSTNELTGEPHIRAIAANCATKFGEREAWDNIVSSIVSSSDRKHDLGEMERNDHTVLSISLSPLPDGATLVSFADSTDRFRIEHALRDRNDALEAADRLKSEFIKHVSYELRTPLNTILGFAEHLASGVPGELTVHQNEYVQAIVSGGNTLRSLVNDILDLSLIESGALRLELERIDLYALLSEVTGHAREWAHKVGLELRLDCREDAGVFLADGRRIRQIVFNLLSNALKYTPRGGTISFIGDIQNEDVRIAVADTGPGISPEVKANVFERFSAKGRSGQRAGAGLGLALVNRFVELHDGWVEIDSSSEGTVVSCHIPRRLHDLPPGERESHAAQ